MTPPELISAGPALLEAVHRLIADVSAADPKGAKPRVKLRVDAPPLFYCGWCGQPDLAENLRAARLTGNNWPIHSACYIAWYDGGPDAQPRSA